MARDFGPFRERFEEYILERTLNHPCLLGSQPCTILPWSAHLGASYALVVSIETEAEGVDIWTPVAQLISVPKKSL